MADIMKSLRAKLATIQQELKAPKNQYNSFGNYKYRNAEDILEALKPYLARESCVLVIDESLVEKGGRCYIESTACLMDLDSEDQIEVSAYAREQEKIKGMHESQITGSTSSYSKKYALGDMFLLDDTKDSDAINKHEKSEQSEESEKVGNDWISKLQGCKTLEELENVWKSMNKTEQKLYNVVKNTVKKNLNK